ncbi:aggregation-promoting factor [Paucilactobacillus wasatchensis]|uniref:Aggregation promoting factor n=1 Tax=Paucilactobacillus wasatchensis TaxID=1335616 RepID=A0A0D1A5S7_9LACO|nr:LysM domain-containing protein [Paucilactobacillus wasatchensis]KIS03245.1 Aggregation promoting factor [Paucilactobacillus wasatchensis]
MKLNKNVVKFSAAVAGAVALGTVAVATNASADTIYTVKSGDTLSQISYNYSNDLSLVDTMVQKNNIADKNLIYVGQKLIIKDDGEVRPATQTEVETTPAASSSATSSSAATSTSATSASAAGSEAAAKAWIANRESGGSYTATNGQYIGKYQLSSSMLNGDYSAANQEKTADSYVASHYGSWAVAKAHSQAYGWY